MPSEKGGEAERLAAWLTQLAVNSRKNAAQRREMAATNRSGTAAMWEEARQLAERQSGRQLPRVSGAQRERDAAVHDRIAAKYDNEADSYEEAAALLRQQADELQGFRTWGIIEVAVRNINVSSYMEHWEGRALKAEQVVAEKDAEITELRRKRVGDSEIIGRWQCQAEQAEAALGRVQALEANWRDPSGVWLSRGMRETLQDCANELRAALRGEGADR